MNCGFVKGMKNFPFFLSLFLNLHAIYMGAHLFFCLLYSYTYIYRHTQKYICKYAHSHIYAHYIIFSFYFLNFFTFSYQFANFILNTALTQAN